MNSLIFTLNPNYELNVKINNNLNYLTGTAEDILRIVRINSFILVICRCTTKICHLVPVKLDAFNKSLTH